MGNRFDNASINSVVEEANKDYSYFIQDQKNSSSAPSSDRDTSFVPGSKKAQYSMGIKIEDVLVGLR